MVFLSSEDVNGVAFKPDNPNILVSCSHDQTIKMWDIASGSCVSTLQVDAGFGGVQCVTFNGTGDTIVAGCDNGNIFFINTTTSQVREPPLKVDGEVSSLDFSPCGTKIAAASNDYRNRKYEIKIFILNPLSGDWEIGSEPPLRVDGEVSSLDISPCGTMIAATCNNYDDDEYEIKMFDLNPRSRDWEIQSESTLT